MMAENARAATIQNSKILPEPANLPDLIGNTLLVRLTHMPTGIKPGICEPSVADENLEMSTEDAHLMTLRLAREEGLLVGVSAGAAMVAALKVVNELTGGVVVTILPDSGDKYLSERFWDEGT